MYISLKVLKLYLLQKGYILYYYWDECVPLSPMFLFYMKALLLSSLLLSVKTEISMKNGLNLEMDVYAVQ